jgi:hypothetical protein
VLAPLVNGERAGHGVAGLRHSPALQPATVWVLRVGRG